MRNLLFSLLVVTAVACKGKSEAPAPAAAAGSGPGSAVARPQPIPNERPAAVVGAPPECDAYKAAVDKLASCTALDVVTRAKLRHAYIESSTKWNAAGSADRAGVAQQCKDGLAALEAAAKAPCKW